MFNGKKAFSLPLIIALCVCSGMLAVTSVRADVRAAMEGRDVIRLWPGAAPGTEDWEGGEFSGQRSVTNVTVPTLSVFYPAHGDANGSAVVVCPGGGFTGLAIIEEGTMVAEWLAARGITAFVLKYRVRHSAFSPEPSVPAASADFDDRLKVMEPGRKIAAADALQAMRYLRANALDYEIDPGRIGMIGFSAGAMTTMSVVTQGDANTIPNFAASIYGEMPGAAVPENAPPLFLVHAQDDAVVPAAKSVEMYTAWSGMGSPVEMHVFATGGHGFGAVRRNQGADQWMELFERWLMDRGWIDVVNE